MGDLAALKTALENDVRYDADVVAGWNGNLLVLLKQQDPTATKVWREVPGKVVRRLIAPGIKTLTVDQRERLKLLVGADGNVDASDVDVRSEFQDIFSGQPAIITALRAVAEVRPCYCEGFGFDVGEMTLHVLWGVLRSIPKSQLARYLAGDFEGP